MGWGKSDKRTGNGAAAHSAAGLTLVEVVITLAMVGLALVAIYGLIFSSIRSFALTEGLLDAQQVARFALDRITEEARAADAVVGDAGCRPTLLCPTGATLHLPQSNPIRPGTDYVVEYRLMSTGELVRRVAGQQEILADGVAAARFDFLTLRGVPADRPEAVARIRVEVAVVRTSGGRERRRTLQTDVALRNLRTAAGEPGLDAQGGETPPPVWRPVPGGPAYQTPPPSPPPAAPEAPVLQPSMTVPAPSSVTVPAPSSVPGAPSPTVAPHPTLSPSPGGALTPAPTPTVPAGGTPQPTPTPTPYAGGSSTPILLPTGYPR